MGRDGFSCRPGTWLRAKTVVAISVKRRQNCQRAAQSGRPSFFNDRRKRANRSQSLNRSGQAAPSNPSQRAARFHHPSLAAFRLAPKALSHGFVFGPRWGFPFSCLQVSWVLRTQDPSSGGELGPWRHFRGRGVSRKHRVDSWREGSFRGSGWPMQHQLGGKISPQARHSVASSARPG
jgi:hypothetical protein